MDTDENEWHRQRMARQKEAFEERKARTTEKKGLLIVHTGAGKGKTTAAHGLAFRVLGQGMKVGIVQFIKGAIPTGEAALAARLSPALEMHTMRDGLTWIARARSSAARRSAAARPPAAPGGAAAPGPAPPRGGLPGPPRTGA